MSRIVSRVRIGIATSRNRSRVGNVGPDVLGHIDGEGYWWIAAAPVQRIVARAGQGGQGASPARTGNIRRHQGVVYIRQNVSDSHHAQSVSYPGITYSNGVCIAIVATVEITSMSLGDRQNRRLYGEASAGCSTGNGFEMITSGIKDSANVTGGVVLNPTAYRRDVG